MLSKIRIDRTENPAFWGSLRTGLANLPLEIVLMRERWIQFSAAVLCGMGACAANLPSSAPSTKPVITTQQATTAATVVVKHEPVAPPPPPPSTPPVVQPVKPVVTTQSPATQPAPPPIVAATQPGPVDDKVAYGVGYSVGRRIHDRLDEDGRTADDLQVIKGFIDGLGDRDPAFSRKDVQAVFAEFQAETLQRRAEKMYADNPAFRKRADENLQKSRAILDQNAEMSGVEVLADGVQIETITPGTGRIVGNAKMLTLKNLRVSLIDGTLLRAADADQPEKMTAADGLPALMDAIRGMKVGCKCRLWLPPDKAYGLTGRPPEVGPNQAIMYEFELVNAE
jgi:FKBP-type peptidyl-prolyl cis-trans isomerase FklB